MTHRPLLSILVLLLGCSTTPTPITVVPSPADPHDEDDPERHRLRERWLENMHRTGPGVDWRAIEDANREAQRRKRNAMVAQLSQPGAGMASGHSWEEVGSRNLAGHTRCAALGPDRAGFRYLYVGSANGGLWRGPQDGSAWEPLSDALFGGVDEVAVIEPANLADEDILVLRRGAQLYRSDDAGQTWTVPSGLGPLTEGRKLLVLPDAQQTILLYGLAKVGAAGASRSAIYASTDGGQTFSLRWNAVSAWRGDLWVPRFGPGAGTDVYLLQAGKVRLSTDAGFNFSLVGTVATGADRGSLQGSEAGAPHFYVALRISSSYRIFRSTDAGANWVDRGAPPAFWGNVSSLASFSTDPDAVFVGGLEGWRSTDGAGTWTRVNGWGAYYGNPTFNLHADLRGLSPMPDPDWLGVLDRLYINTDGGTYLSTDKGQSVQNLSLTGAGPSTDFNQLISGDYGHLTSGDGDHDYVFCAYPGFVLIQTGEQNPTLSTENFPGGSINLWLPPVVADPLDQEDFFFLGDHLWHYEKTGNDWIESLHSNHDFAAGPGSFLTALAFAPADPQRAYAIDNAGQLWWSTDNGVTWAKSTNSGPGNHYFYGNAIAPHPTDPLRAVVSGSGYSSPGVRHTVDGGLTWQAMAKGMVDTLVYDIAWGQDGTDDLYAATEAGAWHYDSLAGKWFDLMGIEAPATTYWSVEAVPTAGIVRFGTYGRGIWDFLVGAPSSAVLFEDSFESGDFVAGGWTVSSSARCRVKPKAARSGAYGARLKKGGQAAKPTSIEKAVDTTGWPTVIVSWSRRSKNYEAQEFLTVEWFDGSTWQLVDASQDTTWGDVSFVLPAGAGNNPAFQVRFSTNAKGKAERSDLDDVKVVGSL